MLTKFNGGFSLIYETLSTVSVYMTYDHTWIETTHYVAE